MIEATVALPVSGPEGAYRVSRSANSLEAAEATVSSPRAAQPAPAATVAATMPPLGSVSLACIMRLLEGRDRRDGVEAPPPRPAAARPPARRPAPPPAGPGPGRAPPAAAPSARGAGQGGSDAWAWVLPYRTVTAPSIIWRWYLQQKRYRPGLAGAVSRM